MRKFTYLLSLLFAIVGTAMAQTYRVPDASTVLTAEQVGALTVETPIVFGPVQVSEYGKWYDGVTTSNNYTISTTLTEENVFVWEPILEGDVASGKGYIKKRSLTENNYLQPANTRTFGAKTTAQVFCPVMPVNGVTAGNTKFDNGNITPGYDETNLVRFVWDGEEKWFNFNGSQYNSGNGIWTAYEVHDATNLQEVKDVEVRVIWSELSNSKAYTLKNERSAILTNNEGTGIRAAVKPLPAINYDAENNRFHFAILQNTKGMYFLYSIKDEKFVASDGSYSDEPVAILHKDGNADSTYVLYYDNSHYMNINNTEGLVINSWNQVDGGNSFQLNSVADFEPSQDLLDKVENVPTFAEEVQALLNTVKANCTFPTQEAEDVTWPSEYVSGGFADFAFLDNAQQAVTDNNDDNALLDYRAKLNSFVSLSNQHGYPVSYLLEYPKNEYGTAYLPFNAITPNGLTLYTCEAVDGNQLTLVEGGDFKKNYAYVVQASEDVRGMKRQIISYGNQKGDQENTNSLLKGTHDGCVASTGSYVLQKHGDVLGFYLVDGTVTVNVPAGKCYLEWPGGESAGVNRLLFPDGTTTGIDAILDGEEAGNAPIYDLSGRRVKNATKGIYIIGGKKVIVK